MMSFSSFLDNVRHDCIDQLTITVEEGEEPEVRRIAHSSGLEVVTSEETSEGVKLVLVEQPL